MTASANAPGQERIKLLLLGGLVIAILLIELLGFNRGFVRGRIYGLTERRYSVGAGSLYEFTLEGGRLISQGNDPNVTFDHVNLPVATVSIACMNSVLGATGQIFYRGKGQAFSESRSVRYDASLPYDAISLDQRPGVPGVPTISSLRLDLTDQAGDSLSCADIVLNPQAALHLNTGRLAIYAILFLLAVSFVTTGGKPASYLRTGRMPMAVVFCILLLTVGPRLLAFAIAQHIVFIVVLSALLFLAAATYSLGYLWADDGPPGDGQGTFAQRYRHELILVGVIAITTWPLLTESYFYYDDWWNIGTGALLNKEFVLALGRPIHTLFQVVFDHVSIRDAYVFKWVFVPALILYAIVLYRWLRVRTGDASLSLCIAGILGIFGPAMDLLGYTATSAVGYSILFAALSVICFERAYESHLGGNRSNVVLQLVLAFALLFTALLTYQVGPQIVFVLLTIDIYFRPPTRSRFGKHAAYLLLFAGAYAFYLLFVRLTNTLYGVAITTNRAETIHSLSQLIARAQFYKDVLNQGVMQALASVTGDTLILERYHGFYISFSHPLVGRALFIVIVLLALLAVASYWQRSRSIYGLLSLMAYMPMSFFVFLVLAQGGYLTYYAFAQITLIMFYFVVGALMAARYVWNRLGKWSLGGTSIVLGPIKVTYVAIPLLALCASVSNYYVRDFYINYNASVYGFVKHSLQTALSSGNIRRIHVFGTISPINADIYSRFVTETALGDLGKNPGDYVITFSRSRYWLARLQEADYLKIQASIPDADRQELDRMYAFEPTYRTYYLTSAPTVADQQELQRIFIEAGAIPEANAPDTLTIDLTWTDQAYLNSGR